MFVIRFVIVIIWYRKNKFKISDVYIWVKRPLEKLHLHLQGGPNTHDDPHETGAARTAARPLLVQKNHFRNYQMSINFWLLYICLSSRSSKQQLFSEITLHRMSFILLVNSLLSDCQALHKQPFRNTCEGKERGFKVIQKF